MTPELLLFPEFKHKLILEVYKCAHLSGVTWYQIIKTHKVC